MKYYEVLFTAKVDCKMTVCVENDADEANGYGGMADTLFEGIRDRIHKNYHVSDYMEEDDYPSITIDDWRLEEQDES